MSYNLEEGTEPWCHWPDIEEFENNFDNENRYYNIPRRYFNIVNGKIYLDSKVATQVEWHIDGELSDTYNIACSGGWVEINGDRFSINPGFWCSYVSKNSLITE